MVRANRANTKHRNSHPSFMPPPARRSTFNAPFPAAGGGLGCALAIGPAKGAQSPGGRERRCAPSTGDQQTEAGATLTPSAATTDQARIPANPAARARRRGQVNDRRRQGPRAKISGEDK